MEIQFGGADSVLLFKNLKCIVSVRVIPVAPNSALTVFYQWTLSVSHKQAHEDLSQKLELRAHISQTNGPLISHKHLNKRLSQT